jgi:hypothetical protein
MFDSSKIFRFHLAIATLFQVEEEPLHPEEVMGWPLEEYDLGQISGVDVDKSGNPVIFHRATVVWDSG